MNQSDNGQHEQSHTYPRYRGILASYCPPTNHRGSRVRLRDEYEISRQENDSRDTPPPKTTKYLSYDYAIGCPLEQALTYLKNEGWNPHGFTELKDGYIILCDSWGVDYKNL